MEFELRSHGGNMNGSEWLSAEGDIHADTAKKLEAFLNEKGYSGAHEIRLNSSGGDLLGGLRLGEFFRKHEFSTWVGSSVRTEFRHYHARSSGTCQSAASIAFIGGKFRHADEGELGVHQFYNPYAFSNPHIKLFGAKDMSEHQALNGILVDYAARMGVDPRFISTGSATAPDSMHFFTAEELDEYRIRWKPWEYEPWQLQPRTGGVIVRSVTRDRSEWAEIFANPVLTLRLHRPWLNQRQWVEDALSAMDGIQIYNQLMSSEAINYHHTGEERVLDVSLASLDVNKVHLCKEFPILAGDGPRYMWGAFGFDIPIEDTTTMMILALKNPIG